ncbi:MAG: hypothetical protein NTW50_00400 [Candidatus Berkelbacteria bacterium]|nr:hypothetical protein [Candidatus Berkelbacteria bacterium]
MKDLDKDLLKSLFEDEKYGEARQVLDQYLAQDLSDAEKGEAYVEAVMEYMTMANEINTRYLSSLQEIVASLKELEEKKEEYIKKIDVSGLKSKIDQL